MSRGFLERTQFDVLRGGLDFLFTLESLLGLLGAPEKSKIFPESRSAARVSTLLGFRNVEELIERYRRHTSAVRSVYNEIMGPQ